MSPLKRVSCPTSNQHCLALQLIRGLLTRNGKISYNSTLFLCIYFRCDTPRHPINAESTQSSLTSVRQLVRSPNISFSDLRSAMTGSMLSWRSWPGPRWYVKDASKHKLSTKVSFSDVDIVRLSTSSSVARDLVVPSKSHEIDLIECEDEDSDNNELENVPPPRSSVPALVVTLLSISIGLSLAYVKIRRMQKLK